ncbi:class I SAM-dependent methyltransferase [Sneathiella chinensis]|nr:class I SAM-dependent methyltransferase [Sneathiella chinensis]
MTFSDRKDHCLACTGTDIAPAYRKDQMTFDRCQSCGFVFMNPMIDEESIAEFYRDYAGTGSYTKKADKKMRRSRRRLRRLKRLVPGGTFLDIGCNAGFVVEAAREAGFDSYGIDLSSEGVAYGKENFPGCTFHNLPIEAAAEHLPKFDLVYSSEVIEHVLDLDSFLRHTADIMKPGGVLYLTTPDAGHWRTPKDLSTWFGFKPPEHSIYFNRASLTHALERFGLKIEKRYLSHKPGLKVLARKVG